MCGGTQRFTKELRDARVVLQNVEKAPGMSVGKKAVPKRWGMGVKSLSQEQQSGSYCGEACQMGYNERFLARQA